MITYIPFLKAKINELNAVGELTSDVRAKICPFFDYPRKSDLTNAALKDGMGDMVRSLGRHIGTSSEFYFDNYDLPDSLTVGGKHNYHFLLESLKVFPVVPIVGVDRSAAHVAAVLALRKLGKLKSNAVAFRVTPNDFESYAAVKDDIVNELAPVFATFDYVDLVFDCRVCTKLDPAATALNIQKFSKNFCNDFKVRRIVISGSSIPASIGEIVHTNEAKIVPRHELKIFQATKAIHLHAVVIFGDYSTVSPDYSDVNIPPQLLQNVMTAKMSYTTKSAHYFVRGGGLKIKGRSQYFGMAKEICEQDFYRGGSFSSGDSYLYEKSLGLGGNCGPNTIIKPCVNAHISFVAADSNS